MWLSASVSLPLLLPPSSPIDCTPLLFLVVVVLLHTQTFSVSLSPSSFLPTSLSLSLILFDLARMISSVEGEKMRAQEGGGVFLLTYSLYVKSRGFFLSPLRSTPPPHPLG